MKMDRAVREDLLDWEMGRGSFKGLHMKRRFFRDIRILLNLSFFLTLP